jgi:tetratricopeptide (TPR) repeat protein
MRVLDLRKATWVPLWNAIEAQLALGRFAAAESTLSRSPDGLMLERLRVRFLQGVREWEAADRYLRSLSADAPHEWNRVRQPVVLGRLAEAERRQAAVQEPLWWAVVRRRFGVDTTGADVAITTVFESRSWATVPAEVRPYPELISALAEVGKVESARVLLAEWRSLGGRDPRLRCDTSQAVGAIALAEGRTDHAVSAYLEWHHAPFCGGQHWVNRGLPEAGTAMDRGGRADTAMALYERALSLHSLGGVMYEATWYPLVLRRLGELHEACGDREKAIEYYWQFVDLWKDADPVLQPQVAVVRMRMERLVAER